MDAPLGADRRPRVSADHWAMFPPAARAVIVTLSQRVTALSAAARSADRRC
jgi:hypothetical protein